MKFMQSKFETKASEGIVLARLIHYIRKPEINLYGVSDEDIYEKGFLNFNHHPDQKGLGKIYHSFGARGTKVNGLPVRLMNSWENAIQRIGSGKLFPASSMKSKNENYNDGAILIAKFSFEQLIKMGFGINIPFKESDKKPYVKLLPEVIRDNLYLKIKEDEILNEIDFGLLARFDSQGYLTGNDGEFYIPKMLPIEEYRDSLFVFRPNYKENCFNKKYWIKDASCFCKI
jgi:hypothetical protein